MTLLSKILFIKIEILTIHFAGRIPSIYFDYRQLKKDSVL